MRIEPATIDDCRAIAEVHVASWQEAYAGIFSSEYLESLSVPKRERAWRAILADGNAQVLVARYGEHVVGFVSFSASRDPDAQPHHGEVSAIYVLPSFWSTGVGLALWQEAKRNLQSQGFSQISLWVISNNARAIRFYTLAGFHGEIGSAKQSERGGTRFQETRYVYQMAANSV
jgi:ribosomal protein S18 acetylase RimI-like enzyme